MDFSVMRSSFRALSALAVVSLCLTGCREDKIEPPTGVSLATGPNIPKRIYVVPNGTGDGTSWTNGADLTTALASAEQLDTLWVKYGTYTPSTSATDARTATFLINKLLVLYGGFRGTETAFEQRVLDQVKFPTVLSGDIAGNDENALNADGFFSPIGNASFDDNVYNVLTVSLGGTAIIKIDGITVRGGMARTTATNSTLLSGGGIRVVGAAQVDIKNAIMTRNYAEDAGGGIAISTTPADLANVIFRENTAGRGGGLRTSFAPFPVTVSNAVFEKNSATNDGGGLLADGGASIVMGSVRFLGNRSIFGRGGAAALVGGRNGRVINAVLSGNRAGPGSESDGGALFVGQHTDFQLTNAVVSGNLSMSGAGLSFNGSSSTLTNVTLSGNACPGSGCGLFVVNGSIAIRNSILYRNTTTTSGAQDAGYLIIGATPSITSSLVQGGFSGTGNINADPLFVSLAGTAPSITGDFRVLGTSPVIDAGDQTVSNPALPLTDLDGNARVQGASVDMGAYETPGDNAAPKADPSAAGTVGANGWYTSDVTVSWNWTDGTGSGIDAANCTTSSTSSGEGSALTLTATCKDKAGNTGSATFAVKVDKTKPVITFVSQLPAANAAGWNKETVTVTWSCSDATSQAVSASTQQSVSVSGANQSVTGTCTDNAGLSATSTRSGINLDLAPPTLAPVVTPNPILLNLSGSVAANAADQVALSGLSGAASCGALVTNSVGVDRVVTCTAVDKAGNTGTGTAKYTVISASTGISNLITLVRSMTRISSVLVTPLTAKLQAAQTDLAARNGPAAIRDLNDFISQVREKRNKGIPAADADVLIKAAQDLILSIQRGI